MIYAAVGLTSGNVKIGITSRAPEARVDQLRRTAGEDLYLLGAWPGDWFDEKQLHMLLRPLRVPGRGHEWYSSGTAVMAALRNEIASMDARIAELRA